MGNVPQHARGNREDQCLQWGQCCTISMCRRKAAPGCVPGTDTTENLHSRTPGQDGARGDGLSRQGCVAYFGVFIA